MPLEMPSRRNSWRTITQLVQLVSQPAWSVYDCLGQGWELLKKNVKLGTKSNIYSETKTRKNNLLVLTNCLPTPLILSTDWLLTLYISNLIFPLPPMYLTVNKSPWIIHVTCALWHCTCKAGSLVSGHRWQEFPWKPFPQQDGWANFVWKLLGTTVTELAIYISPNAHSHFNTGGLRDRGEVGSENRQWSLPFAVKISILANFIEAYGHVSLLLGPSQRCV